MSLSPKRGDLVEIEAGEGAAEILALAEDRQPGEAGLEALEADLLEEADVVGDRPAPFAVVIGAILGRAVAPEAALLAVFAEDHAGHLSAICVPPQSTISLTICRRRPPSPDRLPTIHLSVGFRRHDPRQQGPERTARRQDQCSKPADAMTAASRVWSPELVHVAYRVFPRRPHHPRRSCRCRRPIAASSMAVPRPPSLLSPDLTEPWIVADEAGRRSPSVCQRSGAAPHRLRRPSRLLASRRPIRSRMHRSGLPAARRRLSPAAKPPGTVVIDTERRYLYLVLAGGTWPGATASASAGRASNGRASTPSRARPNGPTGRRRRKWSSASPGCPPR